MRSKKQYDHHRSNVFVYKTITASSPFIEVDLKLSPQQMLMFIHGLKYVTPCQSRFSRQSIDDRVTEQYESISTTVQSCLRDHQMSTTDDRANEAFAALKCILKECHSKPVPSYLMRRAKHERNVVRSIKRLLRGRNDIVVRRTDKCKVFYIGKADDFSRKAEEYMSRTEAYEEISDGRCPLADNLRAAQTLLDYLLLKRALTKRQHQKLLPKLNKLELAYYHGLPKPHKVKSSYLSCLV